MAEQLLQIRSQLHKSFYQACNPEDQENEVQCEMHIIKVPCNKADPNDQRTASNKNCGRGLLKVSYNSPYGGTVLTAATTSCIEREMHALLNAKITTARMRITSGSSLNHPGVMGIWGGVFAEERKYSGTGRMMQDLLQ